MNTIIIQCLSLYKFQPCQYQVGLKLASFARYSPFKISFQSIDPPPELTSLREYPGAHGTTVGVPQELIRTPTLGDGPQPRKPRILPADAGQQSSVLVNGGPAFSNEESLLLKDQI